MAVMSFDWSIAITNVYVRDDIILWCLTMMIIVIIDHDAQPGCKRESGRERENRFKNEIKVYPVHFARNRLFTVASMRNW